MTNRSLSTSTYSNTLSKRRSSHWVALSSLGLVMLFGAFAGTAADGDTQRAEVPVESFELDNGMRFLVVRRPEMSTVAAGWVAHVGSANERPGITGMAHLFEHMMFKGTHTLGTENIVRDLEIIGEQEEVQEEIRRVYGELRRRWRRGEIDDPYAAENRTEELLALEARFDELVEAQREIMIKDQFDQIYTANGASSLNAFTNADETVYIINVPANKLALWFWMESDRLHQPVFREFYSERDVVYEERRLRTESTPTGEFDELVDSTFWQSHPYGWPTVGWPSDLRMISKAQADDFFATYYAPNNITAVLVGNLDLEEVKSLAGRYFGRLPRGEKEPPDVVTLEMPQRAEKRVTAECDCQPQVEIRYHTVPFGHRDEYPLEVLAGVLNGRTGRVYKRMVEGDAIANEGAGAFQSSDKYAGYFVFSAETKGEATPQQLEAAWNVVIAELGERGVPHEELQKVKNVNIANVYRRLQNPFFLMMQLAIFDGLGDWTYLNSMAEKIDAVTAEDVQRVLAQYFHKENRLVAHYARKAGTQAEEIPPELAELPAEMQQQVMQQARQLEQIDDIDQLRGFLAQVEAQADQVPDNLRPAIDFVAGKLRARIAELEGGN